MGVGLDYNKLKAHWDGGIAAAKGDAIYNPLTGKYVPTGGQLPPELQKQGPNSTEARLAHVQVLVASGVITAQEGAEVRKRILEGL
jgi:hypothetical protein